MIPLYKPFMPELPKISEILHSGSLSYGKYTKNFEEALRKYFETKNLIVVNTFENAINISLKVLGLLPGDEVIASPMACLVSTEPYLIAGLKIIWADIDPKRGTLDPKEVEKKITNKTKAIIHNHFCGYPGYVDEINALGKKYNIPVIDDGIESFGSEYKGKKIGNCGTDITIFSLSPVRIPNTIEGGVIIFKKESDFEKALLIRDCGINRLEFRDKLGEINIKCDIKELGFSAMMNDVNGYIGTQQMENVENLLKLHRENAKNWNKFLKNNNEYISIKCKEGNPNYWVYGVLTKNKIETIEKFRKMGYYASGVHIKNNIYSIFKNFENLPGVNKFYSEFVALPCGWWIKDKI